MKTRPKDHNDELDQDEDGNQKELAALGMFCEEPLKLVLQVWTLVEGHKISKVQPGVTTVHQRLGEDCVNFPCLDENRREHEGGAEAAQKLEADADVIAEAGV